MGPYCTFCGRRCFVPRRIPGTFTETLMATCAAGANFDLNRCGHVPMEMDYVEGQFFDASGQWLMCATHGATYTPETGHCVAGPCRRGLIKITVSEAAGEVRWHTSAHLQP